MRQAGIFDPLAVQQFRRRLERTSAERFSTRDNLAFIQILSTQILHEQLVERFAVTSNRGLRDDVTVTDRRSQALCTAA